VDVGPVVAAFLSGGVAGATVKSLVDHLLSDRADRRARLRTLDYERIAMIREAITSFDERCRRQVAEVRIARSRNEEPDSGVWTVQLDEPARVSHAVNALADARLSRLWSDYQPAAQILPFQVLRDEGPPVQEHFYGFAADGHVRRLFDQLIARLNDLERRR
jgi:hypothetical protein